jgi:hypothetical protein
LARKALCLRQERADSAKSLRISRSLPPQNTVPITTSKCSRLQPLPTFRPSLTLLMRLTSCDLNLNNMASSQLFASPPPLSRSSIKVLSSAESLAVVEIFINAALACICHKRKLLPWGSDAFCTRYIDDLQSDYWKHDANKYSTFCDTEPSTLSSTSQQFRVLVRSDVERGNSILDLIVRFRFFFVALS